MKPEKTKKVHYVDNIKFFEEIVEYKKQVKRSVRLKEPAPRIPEYVGSCIWKIANKLANKPSFMNYSFREEMISDGIEKCILYFDRYDPKIGRNPFAYFTQIIYYSFVHRINEEEKNRYIICSNFQHTMVHGGLNHSMGNNQDIINAFEDGEKHLLSSQLYDNINDFMLKFETKERLKKNKRKDVKVGLRKFYKE
jgi:hypothetical protein